MIKAIIFLLEQYLIKSKKKVMKIILLSMGVLFSFLTKAQSSLNNIDFEDGDSSNWNLSIGNICSTYPGCFTNETPGTAALRHTVNTGGYDPDAYVVPKLCPWGGSYSFQLGDNSSGTNGERAYYTHTFAADDTLMNLSFAFVSNDPAGHAPNQMPYFLIEILDSSGAPIPSSVDYYNATDSTMIDTINVGWNNIKFINWTRYVVYDPSFVGKTYTFRFTNTDCALGGHKGRAYIDFTKDSLALVLNTVGPNQILQAPQGFVSYQWSSNINDTLDNLINPATGFYSVDITSANGITFTLSAFVSGTTAINEDLKVKNKFTIFPNPSNSGNITIETNEKATVFVYDLHGKVLMNESVIGTRVLDVSNLKSGNYIMKFVNDSGNIIETKRLNVIE